MNKTMTAGLAALVLMGVLSGCAQHRMGGHGAMQGGGPGMMAGGMGMQAMDANKDGMISRDEFMAHHGSMYDSMPKNSSGMVDMSEMHKGMGHPPKRP